MADSKSKDGKNKKKGGGRSTALAALLAVVAVIAAWLSNCIPGFGIGADGSADGDKAEDAAPAKPEEAKKEETPEEPKPEPAKEAEGESDKPEVAASGPVQVRVDARGCFTAADTEPVACAELCKREGLGGSENKIQIDPTDAPHSMVVELLDCLEAEHEGVEVAVTRDE